MLIIASTNISLIQAIEQETPKVQQTALTKEFECYSVAFGTSGERMEACRSRSKSLNEDHYSVQHIQSPEIKGVYTQHGHEADTFYGLKHEFERQQKSPSWLSKIFGNR